METWVHALQTVLEKPFQASLIVYISLQHRLQHLGGSLTNCTRPNHHTTNFNQMTFFFQLCSQRSNSFNQRCALTLNSDMVFTVNLTTEIFEKIQNCTCITTESLFIPLPHIKKLRETSGFFQTYSHYQWPPIPFLHFWY